MGPDDSIYLTDDGGHFMRKCSLDGKVLLELGIPGKPAPYMSGEPFHRCTHTALSPKGEIYVSDGYGNARVHKYSPDGKLLMSWGGPGTNPGEFNIVHNICTDADGWVYVADRENHRVQVFDGNGKYETQVGTICTGRAASIWTIPATRSAISASSGRSSRSIATARTSVPGSASSTTRASCCRALATCMPARRRPRSWGPMGSASTRAATSMSARSRGPVAAILSGHAATGLHPLAAEIRARALRENGNAGDRWHWRLQISHYRELGQAAGGLVIQRSGRGWQ